MKPLYNIEKIRFATDRPTLERAIGIYESNGVINFKNVGFGFSADVKGSGGNFYKANVSRRHYDHGSCNCYLGSNGTICKHLVALAIYAVKGGKKLKTEDVESIGEVLCSGRLGELSKDELSQVKKAITSAMRYIKPYIGPSRIWFAYQGSLSEGCNRLSSIVSGLPVSEQTAKLLVNMLLRLDKKLCMGGVDDSDGTVGGFISKVVDILEEYAELDLSCIKAFDKLCGQETCFGWEEPLVRIFDEQDID